MRDQGPPRGKLRVKTDSMGTIYMDWVHVWHLESKDSFQLLLANGAPLVITTRSLGPTAMCGSGGVQPVLEMEPTLPARSVAKTIGSGHSSAANVLTTSASSRETTVQIPMSMVVTLRAIDSNFWDRLTGSVSLGYNFTKASDVGQLDFFFTPSYRTRKYQLSLSLSSINTFAATPKRPSARTTPSGTRAFSRTVGSSGRRSATRATTNWA